MILDDKARVAKLIAEVRLVKAQYGITQWEWGFLEKMQAMAHRGFTEKQRRIIGDLERRVFGETKPE